MNDNKILKVKTISNSFFAFSFHFVCLPVNLFYISIQPSFIYLRVSLIFFFMYFYVYHSFLMYFFIYSTKIKTKNYKRIDYQTQALKSLKLLSNMVKDQMTWREGKGFLERLHLVMGKD